MAVNISTLNGVCTTASSSCLLKLVLNHPSAPRVFIAKMSRLAGRSRFVRSGGQRRGAGGPFLDESRQRRTETRQILEQIKPKRCAESKQSRGEKHAKQMRPELSKASPKSASSVSIVPAPQEGSGHNVELRVG